MLLAFATGTGCTALREIPRVDYTARVPERPIRVLTREGLSYELDSASVEADTLVGYHRRDVEGPVDEFDTLRLPLDDVVSISARRVDWYRTGLVGGLSLAVVVAAGLGIRAQSSGSSSNSDCQRNLNCSR
jgi:hypothetical protein